MGNIFNDDFSFGWRLCCNSTRLQKSTGDMDIWVRRTKGDYDKLARAFDEFHLPLFDMTEQKFLDAETTDVFSYGRLPVSIDIITELKGVQFDDAFSQAQTFIENDLKIRFLHLNNLIQAKKAAGRHKDLDDIEKLTSED